MSEIKTLVYFDLEATGLKNSGRSRITEVSFVAANTKDILELQSRLMKISKEVNLLLKMYKYFILDQFGLVKNNMQSIRLFHSQPF